MNYGRISTPDFRRNWKGRVSKSPARMAPGFGVWEGCGDLLVAGEAGELITTIPSGGWS